MHSGAPCNSLRISRLVVISYRAVDDFPRVREADKGDQSGGGLADVWMMSASLNLDVGLFGAHGKSWLQCPIDRVMTS